MPPGVQVPEKSLAEAIETELVRTTNLVSRLIKKLGTANEDARILLVSIQESSILLHERWRAWLKEHPKEARKLIPANGEPYSLSLNLNNRVLGAANIKAVDRIREVAQDMKVKADHARQSADGLGKEVLVKARTKQDAQEINGYWVWYVQRGMLDDKSFHTRFGKQSSPTEERALCPGRYAMWARKDKKEGEPATIRIPSKSGSLNEEVDLDAP
jgi:hypothetical protein